VPDKNVRQLGGYPLMAWTIAVCLRVESIDRVIVSTDSEDYAAVAEQYGAEVPFLRPSALANDDSTDLEFVEHALERLESGGCRPTHLVHMRPTTPFRDPDIVDEALRQFRNSDGATALRSVHEMSESAHKALEVTSEGWLARLGRIDTALDAANLGRQSFPNTYLANGYVDVLSVAFIRSSGSLHGDRVMAFITPPVVEVDTELEFKFLEFCVAND
ncbi:uncharacterized protein METZ01_LOCUS436522, partial [marine metagenome]